MRGKLVKLIHIVSATITLALLLAWVSTVQGSEKKDPKSLQAERRLLDRKSREVHSKLRAAKREERLISHDLKNTRARLSKAQKKLDELNRKLDKTQNQWTHIRKEVETRKKRLERHRTRLANRLVGIHKNGSPGYLSFISNIQSLDETAARLYMLRKIVSHDTELIDLVVVEKDELERKESQLTEAVETLQELHAGINHEKDSLLAEKNIEERLFNAIKTKMAMYERYLKEWQQGSRLIETRLKEIQKEEPSSKSTLFGPFQQPVQGRIVSGFGMRRHPILKRRRFHYGWDIAAQAGVNIRAAKAGIVVFSGWRSAYGNCIVLDHGNGWGTVYGHCSKLLVGIGQKLKKGRIIAKVGSTGLSTGPHLHFEIRRYGSPVNPRKVR